MSIERDELARDLYVACAAVRMTPREAYEAAEAFVREREQRRALDALADWPRMPGSVGETIGLKPLPTEAELRRQAAERTNTPIAPIATTLPVDAVPGATMRVHGDAPMSAESVAAVQDVAAAALRATEPRWGRAHVRGGGPYSSRVWHLWLHGESHCGERADGEPVPGMPEPEHTCDDCRASETGEVQPEPDEYDPPGPAHSGPTSGRALGAAPLNIPSTHTGATVASPAPGVYVAGPVVVLPVLPARPKRKPRLCCAPGCGAPGKAAKNSSGAKVARSAYLCAAHMGSAETEPLLVRTWASGRTAEVVP